MHTVHTLPGRKDSMTAYLADVTRRGAVSVALAAVVVVAPAAAHAVQLESADRDVSTVRVSYVEPIGARKLYVELNNGAAYRLNPCRVEDGRQCYWDAGDAGNGAGSSFVRVSGRIIFSAMVGGAR